MYRGRLKRDLALWTEKGLLSADAAQSILAELDSRKSSFSFGNVLMMLAAVLIAAAILLLVAANWQAIPRLMKIGGIFFLIWIFHGLAILAYFKQRPMLVSVFLVLGSASFGGAIALIGQAYHLSGDALQAALLWFAVSALTGGLVRSSALTVMSGLLALLVCYYILEDIGLDPDWLSDAWSYVPLALSPILAWLSLRSGNERSLHFPYMIASGWLLWMAGIDRFDAASLIVAVLAYALFLGLAIQGSPAYRLRQRFGGATTFYPLLLAALSAAFVQFSELGVFEAVLTGLAILAGSLLALALEGRDNGAVRFLAYFVFALEVLYLSYETIDSIMGTAAFFLLAGVIVALLALVVIRLEKHFGRNVQRKV
ncbi:DUF2157 domain-containing protein [Peteryoungia desertarenae]|uniref:DUF2157 domain-containing protein n=1 Tax=Peteryoungia desertarenae TaxID=1813451 RepID=A0ABX6QP56_9HYPH|nr:DUF2157 domain-containing protein [Peteryoungia desertarenae]QLF70308.1 DUF2157 domain-containing protein [Peteryoungia desertarenae]